MLKKALGMAVAVIVALNVSAPGLRASRADAEVVIEWNQLLQATIPAAGLMSPRFFAMLHVAMFDAINSIDEKYTPFLGRVRGSGGASAEAAAAQAAHDVLAALIPAHQATYDAALQARLEEISPGRASSGVRIGRKIARRVLDWRLDDGWQVPPPPYEPAPIAGRWQRTPPGAAAGFTQFPDVRPFALLTPTVFLPPPPPELNTARYAEDFNEVKLLGSVDSPARTPEQTLRSRLFAGVVTRTTLFAMWNNVARDAAEARGLSLVDTARLFALMNVSINDSLQSTHTSKFVYGLWRPITAIRRADEDMNPDTDPDTGWTSLITNPPYPAYAGNMAGVGASAATALRLALGDDEIPVTVRWVGIAPQPDIERTFSSFWDLAEAQAISRLHAGIHFTFDNKAGQQTGIKVAQYVSDHFMISVRGDRD